MFEMSIFFHRISFSLSILMTNNHLKQLIAFLNHPEYHEYCICQNLDFSEMSECCSWDGWDSNFM